MRVRRGERRASTRAIVLSLSALFALALAATLARGERPSLPRDYRDESLDDDDARLRASESVAYATERKTFGDVRGGGGGASGGGERPREWIEQISASPRAYVYRNFLSEAETEEIVRLAHPTMRRSQVVNDDTGDSKTTEERTSMGGWVDGEKSETVADVELRVAAWTMLPPNRGETIQVMRYEAGQEYQSHHDYFHDDVNVVNGGQRLATVLMYLSDVEEGGETVFPLGTPLGRKSTNKKRFKEEDACELARKGDPDVLAVKPRRGDALLFYSAHLNGEMDETSLHAGCPVVKGTKWTATRWQRVGAIDVGSFAREPIDAQNSA